MTEKTTTEIFRLFFRDTRLGKPKINQAYVDLWMKYQRGAFSADEFLRRVEHEFRRSVEPFD